MPAGAEQVGEAAVTMLRRGYCPNLLEPLDSEQERTYSPDNLSAAQPPANMAVMDAKGGSEWEDPGNAAHLDHFIKTADLIAGKAVIASHKYMAETILEDQAAQQAGANIVCKSRTEPLQRRRDPLPHTALQPKRSNREYRRNNDAGRAAVLRCQAPDLGGP